MATLHAEIDVTLSDHYYDAEIDLDPHTVADAFFGQENDLLDALPAETVRRWYEANNTTFTPEPKLTDDQRADLNRAAIILDALQTLLNMENSSSLAVKLRTLTTT